MSILSEYIGAWMGTSVTEAQAQALLDATATEEAIKAFRALPRPMVHGPVRNTHEAAYMETEPPSDAPTGYGTGYDGDVVVHERKPLTQ